MVSEIDVDEVLKLLARVSNGSRYTGSDPVGVVGLAIQLAALKQQAQANAFLKEIASCVVARASGEEHVILTG